MAHGPRFLRIAEDGSTGNDYLFILLYLFVHLCSQFSFLWKLRHKFIAMNDIRFLTERKVFQEL